MLFTRDLPPQTLNKPELLLNQKPLRVAVLGYGLAGRVFHCPFVSAVQGLELAAIVQRTAHPGSDAAEASPLRSI